MKIQLVRGLKISIRVRQNVFFLIDVKHPMGRLTKVIKIQLDLTIRFIKKAKLVTCQMHKSDLMCSSNNKINSQWLRHKLRCLYLITLTLKLTEEKIF